MSCVDVLIPGLLIGFYKLSFSLISSPFFLPNLYIFNFLNIISASWDQSKPWSSISVLSCFFHFPLPNSWDWWATVLEAKRVSLLLKLCVCLTQGHVWIFLEVQRLHKAHSQRSFGEEHACYVDSISALGCNAPSSLHSPLSLQKSGISGSHSPVQGNCWRPSSKAAEGLRIKEGEIFHEDCCTSILPDLPIRAEIISTFYTVGMSEGPQYPTQPSLFTGEDNRSPMRGGDVIWQWKGDSALGSRLQLRDSCLAPCHVPNSLTPHGSDYWNVVRMWQI